MTSFGRKYPLTAEEFHSFLESYHCEENFDFLVDVTDYRNIAPESRDSKAKSILETFVIEGSTKEINIDGNMRDKIVRDVKFASPEVPLSTSVFDHAAKEARRLIFGGNYVALFAKITAGVNISAQKQKMYWMLGFIFLALSLALGLSLWLATDVSRWTRITVFVPAVMASFFLLGASQQFCPHMGYLQLRMLNSGYVNVGRHPIISLLEDPQTIACTQQKTRKNLLITAILAIVWTAIFVALPSVN